MEAVLRHTNLLSLLDELDAGDERRRVEARRQEELWRIEREEARARQREAEERRREARVARTELQREQQRERQRRREQLEREVQAERQRQSRQSLEGSRIAREVRFCMSHYFFEWT